VQIDGFFIQLPYKCHQNRVASVGDWLKICPWVAYRVVLVQPFSPAPFPHLRAGRGSLTCVLRILVYLVMYDSG